MLTAIQVFRDITSVTETVISAGITDKENRPSMKKEGKIDIIGISGADDISSALKNLPYENSYDIITTNKFYNFIFADGGIIQMIYLFDKGCIWKHKLAYYPSPKFESFQNESEYYMEDCIYLEVLDRRILPVPIRFDYDNSPETYKELHHPKSHLTLGQYKNCRIPVCSPVTPSLFVEFILRSFYNTALINLSNIIKFQDHNFNQTATKLEMDRIHIRLKS